MVKEDSTIDRTQVGLTGDANEQLLEIKEVSPYFRDEADVYRLAVSVALALRAEVSTGLQNANYSTKFRVMRTDLGEEDLPRLDGPDRRLATMIELFYPSAGGQPYRYSMYLAVIGINHLHEQLVTLQKPLSRVIDELNRNDAAAKGEQPPK